MLKILPLPGIITALPIFRIRWKVVREGFKSMQALQMQTAETHKISWNPGKSQHGASDHDGKLPKACGNILGHNSSGNLREKSRFHSPRPGYADSEENIPGPAHVLSENKKIIKKDPDPARADIRQDTFTTRSYPEKSAEKTIKAKIPANNGRGKIESQCLKL